MSVAERIVHLLHERGRTLAVAESLTGGLVCAALTSVPGASHVLRGGVVSYATDIKAGMLGVDQELLSSAGPVQAEVAAQMAAGVRHVCHATWGLATTGVAGPGPADGHPAGTVFIGLAGADVRTARQVSGLVDRAARGADRAEIRTATVEDALAFALDTLARLA